MTTNSKSRKATNVPRIPTSWLILIVFLGILYSLFQPWANARLGLKLPSIPELISSERSQPTQRPKSDSSANEKRASEAAEAEATENEATEHEATENAATRSKKQVDESTSSTTAKPSTNAQDDENSTTDESPYDLLKNTGSEVYVSEAGLRYTRGSEEGHRIKHLARHLEDMPERSGNHGVFEGGWRVTLQRIDETYRRSKQNDPKTKVRKEDNRSIIETEFDQTIGYVGGKEGARKGNPSTRRLRLVTEGDRFITAFPF